MRINNLLIICATQKRPETFKNIMFKHNRIEYKLCIYTDINYTWF